ncbi:hypothetical protein WG947_15790 [Pontibacter sp. H259]|uniref:hypothetical protein n=1 Tax=Pontibacter sp. H259 TaxID=3133421 RepID=UPI0030C11E04
MDGFGCRKLRFPVKYNTSISYKNSTKVNRPDKLFILIRAVVYSLNYREDVLTAKFYLPE